MEPVVSIFGLPLNLPMWDFCRSESCPPLPLATGFFSLFYELVYIYIATDVHYFFLVEGVRFRQHPTHAGDLVKLKHNKSKTKGERKTKAKKKQSKSKAKQKQNKNKKKQEQKQKQKQRKRKVKQKQKQSKSKSKNKAKSKTKQNQSKINVAT